MKNLQKLRASKHKNNENDESSLENIGIFDTLITTVTSAVVLGVLFYVNSPEFDLHHRSKRALNFFETPENLDDIAPVHLVADNDFDLMHRRKNRDLDDFTDFLEGENLDESENNNDDNSTAEFQSFLSEIGVDDAGEYNLMAENDDSSSSDSTSSTDTFDENGSGIDLGVFDYDASADGSGFNDYSDEDETLFARSFSETPENPKNAENAKTMKITARRRGGRRNRRKNREKNINWNRLKQTDLETIAPKMHAKFDERMKEFTNILHNVSLAVEDPEKVSELGYDDYKGYSRTAPMVNKFINALDCKPNGEGLFKQPGKTSIYVLFPGAVSLFSEPGKVVEDYGYFWKWWMKVAELLPTDRFNNVRFSVGVYSTSAAFTPKGFKPRNNMPWDRLQRFYKAPRMTAVQPALLSAAARVNTWVYSYGSSTPMVGDNCVFFWFVHNVPSDLDKFNIPEHYSHWKDLKSMCNVIPILIAPEDKDPENAWGRLAAVLEPSLQTQIPKDPEFSGVFRLNKHEELVSDGFLKTMFQYLCLLESRTLCRFKKKGFVFDKEVVEDVVVEEEGFRVYDEGGMDEGKDYEYFGNSEEVAVTEAPKKKGAVDVPEADVCCGHEMYSGIAYNNEERTCCANGDVKKYLETGLDACVMVPDDLVF